MLLPACLPLRPSGAASSLAASLNGAGNTDKHGAETNKKEHSAEATDADEEAEDVATKKVGVVIAPKEDIVFNPKKDVPSRYVVIGIGIEVATEEEKKIVEDELMIPINSAFLKKLRSYTLDEIDRRSAGLPADYSEKRNTPALSRSKTKKHLYFQVYYTVAGCPTFAVFLHSCVVKDELWLTYSPKMKLIPC